MPITRNRTAARKQLERQADKMAQQIIAKQPSDWSEHIGEFLHQERDATRLVKLLQRKLIESGKVPDTFKLKLMWHGDARSSDDVTLHYSRR